MRQNTKATSLFDWLSTVVKIGAPIFVVVAGLVYVVLRVYYERFYARFGVTPEEVGLGRTELLTQAIAGPVILAITHVFLVMFVLVVYIAVLVAPSYLSDIGRGIRAFVRRRTRKSFVAGFIGGPELQPKRRRRRRWLRIGAWIVASLSLVIGLGSAGSTLSLTEKIARDVVSRGYTVHPVSTKLTPFKITVFNVRAEPLTVQWRSASIPAAFQGTNDDCLMYLGQNDGTIVAWDVKGRNSVRFAADDTVLLVHHYDFVPEWCTRR